MKFIKFICKIVVGVIVAIMITALLLVLVSLFVTPATFGLESLEINGVTIEEQGLADTTFYNIGKIALGILMVEDEESLDEEVYDVVISKLPESTDSEETEESLSGLLTGKVYFEEEVEISVASDELAALMNMVINGRSVSTLGDLTTFAALDYDGVVLLSSNVEALDDKINLSDAEEYFEMSSAELIEIMQEYSCEFINIDPYIYGDYLYFTTIVKFTLPEDVIVEVNSLGVITISEYVYCTFDSCYILENGELVAVKANESSMKINSLSEDSTVTVAGSMMSIVYGEEVDGEEVMTEYNNTSTSMMATILNNLGEVQGVENGEIVIQTRTE